MSKGPKTNKTNIVLIPINGSTHLNDTNKEYALYTAQSRAIPSAWDGVKDGNRKALWLLKNKTKEIKTVSLAGEMISSGLFLHGDASASDAIGKMAAPYQNSLPLITGNGNFGSRKKPGAVGAPRYTYVQQNAVTKHIVYPDMEIMPMKENYDGSTVEPMHFLPIIPIALLNGIEGMAVGFSTNILPHSINDLLKATLQVLDGKLPSLTPKYDCIGGSYPLVLERNKYEFLGAVDIIDDQTVEITNLPPGTTVEKMMEQLYQMEDDSTNNIRDIKEDSNETISIVVKFTRGFCKEWDENTAIDFFKLYKRDTQRLVMIDWDNETVRQFRSSEEYVIEFVEHRFSYYIKRYEMFLKNTISTLQQWDLVKACYDENLPGDLKNFKSKKDLVNKISAHNKKHKCNADSDQIEKVAALPTYRWVKDHYQEVLDKITELNEEKDYYEDLLSDEDSIWAIYREEVAALTKIKFTTGRESV